MPLKNTKYGWKEVRQDINDSYELTSAWFQTHGGLILLLESKVRSRDQRKLLSVEEKNLKTLVESINAYYS